MTYAPLYFLQAAYSYHWLSQKANALLNSSVLVFTAPAYRVKHLHDSTCLNLPQKHSRYHVSAIVVDDTRSRRKISNIDNFVILITLCPRFQMFQPCFSVMLSLCGNPYFLYNREIQDQWQAVANKNSYRPISHSNWLHHLLQHMTKMCAACLDKMVVTLIKNTKGNHETSCIRCRRNHLKRNQKLMWLFNKYPPLPLFATLLHKKTQALLKLLRQCLQS